MFGSIDGEDEVLAAEQPMEVEEIIQEVKAKPKGRKVKVVRKRSSIKREPLQPPVENTSEEDDPEAVEEIAPPPPKKRILAAAKRAGMADQSPGKKSSRRGGKRKS